MSSDAKEHIRDKLRCRLTGAVASARPRESAAIFSLSQMIVGLKCAQASRVYLSAFTFLSVVFIDFCLGKCICWYSVVVPPVFPSFCLCLPCPFVFCFVCFASFFSFFLSSAFITNLFLLRITDWEQFTVRISKDEASFDRYLSGRCESVKGKQRTFAHPTAAHSRGIRVVFSLWSD